MRSAKRHGNHAQKFEEPLKKAIMKKRLLASLIALVSINVAAQGIPVFDLASTLNFMKALTNDVTKINALNQQIQYWKQQMQATTGSRGMGALAVLGASQGLPEWSTILQQVQSSSGQYAQLVQSVAGTNAALGPEQLSRMSLDQIALLQRVRNLGATQKVIADMTTDVAGKQIGEIQALSGQIDKATDPKAISDLNAAMNAKKLELDNTRIKLWTLDQEVQAEQKQIEERRTELALKTFDSSQPSQVHVDP